MFNLNSHQSTLLRYCKIIFAGTLLFFALRIIIYHYHLISFPYANTYREGGIMTSTYALTHGLNPYALKLQPQYTNLYGIVYPLFVLPFAKIFGVNVVVHRAVSGLFILASCVLCGLVMKRLRIPLLLNAAATLMLYASLVFQKTSTACVDPGAMGMFFMLATVFIPFLLNYSSRSLMISIGCGLLAYYSKPYCVLGVAVIASYMFLFVSKKKGLIYSFSWAASLLISIMYINAVFPTYFNNCFFIFFNNTSSSFTRLLEQLNQYALIHAGLLIILVGLLAYSIWHQPLRQQLITHLRNAFTHKQCPLIIYAGLCSWLILYFWMGRNTGAMLWYFFQLFSPYFLIGCAWAISRFPLWLFLTGPLLIYNLYFITANLDPSYFRKNMLGWPKAVELINGHQHILACPLFAPLLIEQNKEVFDNGMSQDFVIGGKRSKFPVKYFFKDDPNIFTTQLRYQLKTEQRIQQHAYDLLLIQPNDSPGVPNSITTYYQMIDSFWVYAPHDRLPYMITAWKPKDGFEAN